MLTLGFLAAVLAAGFLIRAAVSEVLLRKASTEDTSAAFHSYAASSSLRFAIGAAVVAAIAVVAGTSIGGSDVGNRISTAESTHWQAAEPTGG